MTDSLSDLLKQRQFDEPPEIAIIKRFLRENYDSEGTVTIRDNQIIISVKSASLAGMLRMRLHELQEQCHTEKKLIIRIG